MSQDEIVAIQKAVIWYFTNGGEFYDFTSSDPYVMVTHKFPSKEFKPCKITNRNQMLKSFAYLLKVRFYNIKCKYYNNFISQSKCIRIKNGNWNNFNSLKS